MKIGYLDFLRSAPIGNWSIWSNRSEENEWITIKIAEKDYLAYYVADYEHDDHPAKHMHENDMGNAQLELIDYIDQGVFFNRDLTKILK